MGSSRAGGVERREQFVEKCLKKLASLKSRYPAKSQLKKKLINTILVELYPRGLNTLQLAQIDVQLLVDRPSGVGWVSSTMKVVDKTEKIPNGEDDLEDEGRNNAVKGLRDYTVSLDSQLFLDRFVTSLANLYLIHVYISRHPYFPLILVRVQMYDYSYGRRAPSKQRALISDLTKTTLDKTDKVRFERDFERILQNQGSPRAGPGARSGLQRQIQIENQPAIRSHRPFYILLPLSSPHVIHTPFSNDDVSTRLILQTLETTFATMHTQEKQQKRPPRNTDQRHEAGLGNQIDTGTSIVRHELIKLFRDSDVPKPIKNLGTLFLLKGISRFGEAMGAWTPYAEDMVDMSIFGSELRHLIVQPEAFIDLTADDDTDGGKAADEAEVVAALKFKGRVTRLGEDKTPVLGTKYNAIDLEHEDSDDAGGYNTKTMLQRKSQRQDDPYASRIPFSDIQFDVQGDILQYYKEKRNGVHGQRNRTVASDLQSTFAFSMELLGTDIYGGLHQLAANRLVDPYTVPDWLTGEGGARGGTVKQGKLKKR